MLKGVNQRLEHQQIPTFFVSGNSVFSRMVFFFALSIVLMAADTSFNYLSQVRQAFAGGLQPLERIANIPGELTRDSKRYFATHNQLVQDNHILKQQALENAVKLQRLNTLQAKNEYLRSLLSGDIPIYPRAVLGDIAHAGRDPFKKVVIVNRGRQHNIQTGQAVVDAKGVLGQVTHVYPFSSEITMITDESFSIPIQVERNQLRAIAFGQGGNSLDIPYLPSNIDIKVGDKLVTSGLDGIYPAGLAVATVTRIDQDPETSFAKIISTPAAKVSYHLQLLILESLESKEAPSNKAIDNKGTKLNAKNT